MPKNTNATDTKVQETKTNNNGNINGKIEKQKIAKKDAKKPVLPKPMMPKPKKDENGGYQVWLVTMIIVLVLSMVYFNRSAAPAETTYNRFKQMYAAGDTLDLQLPAKMRVHEADLRYALRSAIRDEMRARGGVT